MEKPIEAGDLVIITWRCCGAFSGMIKTVDRIYEEPIAMGYGLRCAMCNKHVDYSTLADLSPTFQGFTYARAPLAWLRRIPPMEELQSDRLREEQPA